MSDYYTSPEARELAGKVRQVVLKQGELHDQGMWFTFDAENPAAEEVECDYYEAIRIPVAFYLEALKDENPATHCGTTACAAGWASIFAAPPGSYVSDTCIYLPDGQRFTADSYGQEKLGLNMDEADYLFASCRTRAEVIAALEDIEETGSISDETLAEWLGRTCDDDDEEDEIEA